MAYHYEFIVTVTDDDGVMGYECKDMETAIDATAGELVDKGWSEYREGETLWDSAILMLRARIDRHTRSWSMWHPDYEVKYERKLVRS